MAGTGAERDCRSPVFPEKTWFVPRHRMVPGSFQSVPLAFAIAHDLRGSRRKPRRTFVKRGLCSALPLRASHDDPPADGSWQGVDEEDQEDDEDEQNEGDDDVLLVVPPDEVVQALEGAHEPREGGVWAAREENREGVMFKTQESQTPKEHF